MSATCAENNLFGTLADITISNIFTWLLPHERLLCAKICKLFRDNIYSFVTFSDIWMCHNPWIESNRFGFSQSIHHRGYNNAFLLNLLPYTVRKLNYDKYRHKHQQLQEALKTANEEFGDDLDTKEDHNNNEKYIIDTHPPQKKIITRTKLLHHVRCLCIAKDVALTLYNLSQQHQYNHILSNNIRFIIIYLPHPSLCYRYYKMKLNLNKAQQNTETLTKYTKLKDMTRSIQMGLDIFTKIKYLCLVELNTYYISNLNLNKFTDLCVLHLYAIDKSMDWSLMIAALSNQQHDILSNVLVLSLEHCTNIPIKLCGKLFECCNHIKHLTLIRNTFMDISEYDIDNKYLVLPSTIASLVWFKNKYRIYGASDNTDTEDTVDTNHELINIAPVLEHCPKLYQLFMSYMEIIELIPLFFGGKQNNGIKQIWIIDQRIEIAITDLISESSDTVFEESDVKFDSEKTHVQTLDKIHEQNGILKVFVREIWISKVVETFENILNCTVYPIPSDWHCVNPHFTINECSFLTQLRHCTDCFCLDDIIYDGV